MRGIGLAAVAALAMVAGTPAGAVVQGRSDPALARHTVMVLTNKGGFCSASVIAPTVILTAAHCVTGASAYKVHYKENDGSPVLLDPASIAVHPGYDAGAVKGRRRSIDMALVRLSAPLPSRFAPIALSAAPRPAAGDTLTVGGYGLGQEGMPTTGGQFRAADLGVIEPFGPSSILVWLTDPRTGRSASGSGACQGDSGGPVFAADGVLAVTVWAEGPGKAACGALTQGLLVAPQRAWIDGVLAKWR